jgi:predicted transcriptional regulator
MREAGMIQQAIADELGMAQSHVSRIVRGENRV